MSGFTHIDELLDRFDSEWTEKSTVRLPDILKQVPEDRKSERLIIVLRHFRDIFPLV